MPSITQSPSHFGRIDDDIPLQTKMKKTYRPKAKLEVFYTGGPIRHAPNNSTFACACLQETKIVDALSGAVIATLPGDGEWVTALSFTPDGNWIYTASRSLSMKKWCMESKECIKSLKGHTAPVSDICVDPSGSVVAFGSADRTITVYDVRGSFRTHTFRGHKAPVLRVMFHPTEAELLSCSTDHSIKVWDLHRSQLKATLKGHSNAVSTACYTDDGKYCVSAGKDNIVIVWSMRTCVKCAEFPIFEAVEDIICLPSVMVQTMLQKTSRKTRYPQVLFVSGGERGIVRLWRTDTGSDVLERKELKLSNEPGHEIVALQRVAASDGYFVAKADCSIEFIKFEGSHGIGDGGIKVEPVRFLIGNMDEITDVAFLAPCDRPQIAVASNSPHIQVIDATSLNCLRTLSGHSDAVLCIAASSFKSCPLIFSGSKDQSIRLWDGVSGSCLADATGHAAAVSAITVSRKESRYLVSVSADKLVKLWKLKLQTKSDGTVAVEKFKVTSGVMAHSKEINCVDISPNDAMIATGSMDKSIKIMALPNLTTQATLQGHKRGVWSVQFSSSDKTILSSSADTLIKMWSLTDWTCIRTFEGDGLLKLWNVLTCDCVSTFDEHEDRIWSIAFYGEHQEMMVSGGSDSNLIIWEDTTEKDKGEEIRQQQEDLNKQQKLANAIQLRDYRAASKLAFEIEHPQKLLTIMKKNLPKLDHVYVFSAIVDLLVDGATLKRCLEYIREWNTNSRHNEEAQMLLKMILERHPPQTIASIPGIAPVLSGIESYSVRHHNRLQKLHQATYLVDYVLDSMYVLEPEPAMDCDGDETNAMES